MKGKHYIDLILTVILLSGFCSSAVSAEGSEDIPMESPAGPRHLSLENCVLFSIRNSFEVKMAKLDLLIAGTERMLSESIFDTTFFGEAGYREDKSQQLSVFASDDNQSNEYSAGLTKKLITGTTLTASVGDTRGWSNTAFISRNPAHEAKFELEAVQSVGKNFFGYVDRRELSVTRLAIKNSDLDTKDRIEEVISNTAKSYWRKVFAKLSLDINVIMLEKARELHKTNTRNYDVGIMEKGDFLSSQANVLLREKDVLLAENDHKRAEEDLKLLINLDRSAVISSMDLFPDLVMEYDLPDWLKMAFENRRDYLIGKRDIDIKNLELQMKKNNRWPEIDLTLSMAVNGLDNDIRKAIDKTTGFDNTNYFAGVEFSVPLENNLARSEFKKAAFQKEKALIELKNLERNIITEIANAYRDVKTYEINLSTINAAVLLQKEKLEAEEKKFGHGRSSTKTVIDYQQDLLNARLDNADAMLKLQESRIDLQRAVNIMLREYEEFV